MRFDWWTFGLQTINFLILAWLLQHFLYRPVMRVVSARREQSDHLLADAEAGTKKAEALQDEVTKRRAALEGERDGLLAEARKAADEKSAATLDEARARATTLVADAEAKAARMVADAHREIRQRAASLATAMAARLARSASPPPEAFLDQLGEAIDALSGEARAALADGTLDVATATPLAPEAEARIRAWLAKRLGTDSGAASVTVDPALLAGLELRARHAVLRSCWAADLERLATAAAHDDSRT